VEEAKFMHAKVYTHTQQVHLTTIRWWKLC